MSNNVREGEEVRLPGGGGGYPRPNRAGGNPSPMVPYSASTYHKDLSLIGRDIGR